MTPGRVGNVSRCASEKDIRLYWRPRKSARFRWPVSRHLPPRCRSESHTAQLLEIRILRPQRRAERPRGRVHHAVGHREFVLQSERRRRERERCREIHHFTLQRLLSSDETSTYGGNVTQRASPVSMTRARDRLFSPESRPTFITGRQVCSESSSGGGVIGMCGAGGNGSTAGSPMRSNANFAAPAGYALDPSSVHLVKREKPSGWQYGLARDPQFTWTRLPEDAEFPRTMVGTPGPCEGENGHTQGRVDFTWEIQAFIDTAVLVP